MPDASTLDLAVVAEDFRLLAERFQEYARRAEKPSHLSRNVYQGALRAGQLVQEAVVDGGALERYGWRKGRTPLTGWTSSRDTERFLMLWKFTITSWLAEHYPGKIRRDLSKYDWWHAATDKDGRLLGKDSKPLVQRWYRDGEPVPDDVRVDPHNLEAGHRWEWKLDGEIAGETDFHDASDSLEHLRNRAEVYADACRLLAELIAQTHGAARSSSDREQDEMPPASEALTRLEEDDGNARLSPRDMARRYRVPLDPLRKRLERCRRRDHACYAELDEAERSVREAKYIYALGRVRHIIRDLIVSSETSSKRPPRKSGSP